MAFHPFVVLQSNYCENWSPEMPRVETTNSWRETKRIQPVWKVENLNHGQVKLGKSAPQSYQAAKFRTEFLRRATFCLSPCFRETRILPMFVVTDAEKPPFVSDRASATAMHFPILVLLCFIRGNQGIPKLITLGVIISCKDIPCTHTICWSQSIDIPRSSLVL